MSKEKISMQEIVDLMVQRRNMTRKSAEEFVRLLLSTMEESLIEGDSVKITGFGTFKPQWNEPRKSVDVNTGNEIVIEGYYKVAFTPDSELKVLINEPFSHLETVEIGSRNVEITEPENETNNFKPMVEPMRVFEEQAEEIKGLLNEIGALSINKPAAHVENISTEKSNETSDNETSASVDTIDEVENIVVTDEEQDNRIVDEEEEPVQQISEEMQPVQITDGNDLFVEDTESQSIAIPNDFDIIRQGGKVIFPFEKELPENQNPKPEFVTGVNPPAKPLATMSLLQEPVVSEEDQLSDLPIENSPENSEPTNYEPPYFGTENPENNEPESEKKVEVAKPEDKTGSDSENAATETNSQPYVPESITEEPVDSFELEEKTKRPVWVYILSVVVLIALAAVATWFFYPQIFDNLKNKPAQTLPEVTEQTNINPVEPVIPDSLATANASPDTIINVFDAPREFTEYIASEPMKRGSMLSIFAKKHLGHPYFWVYIFEANKDIIKDPNNVPLGVQIKIPKVDPRLVDVSNPDCIDFALKLSEQYLK